MMTINSSMVSPKIASMGSDIIPRKDNKYSIIVQNFNLICESFFRRFRSDSIASVSVSYISTFTLHLSCTSHLI